MRIRQVIAGFGAGLILLTGASTAASAVNTTQADFDQQDAEEIALEAHPEAEVVEVESEEEGDGLVYEVELSNGVEMEIDGETGEILDTRGGPDATATPEVRGPILEPAVGLIEAQEIALQENEGASVESVELELDDSGFIWESSLDNERRVEIDATTGDVLETNDSDDEDDEDDN